MAKWLISMKKFVSYIRNHLLLTITLILLIVVSFVFANHRITTHIDFSKVSYIQISIANYDQMGSELTLKVENFNDFDKMQAFIDSIQKISGFNPLANRARWYMEIDYMYNNGSKRSKEIIGDKNYDKLAQNIKLAQNEGFALFDQS